MGTNTIATVLNGQVGSEEKWNQYKTALCGDIVPRNTAGAATDLGGDLGTSSYRFGDIYAKDVNIDTITADGGELHAGNLDVEDDSTDSVISNQGAGGIRLVSTGAVRRELTAQTSSANLSNGEYIHLQVDLSYPFSSSLSHSFSITGTRPTLVTFRFVSTNLTPTVDELTCTFDSCQIIYEAATVSTLTRSAIIIPNGTETVSFTGTLGVASLETGYYVITIMEIF